MELARRFARRKMLASRVVFTALRRPIARSVRALATTTQNPYDVLGVGRKSTQAEVKAAYLKAAKLSHPDSASSSDGPSFEAVNAAYESLSTPARRSRTDADLDAPPQNLRADFEDLVLMAEGGQLGKAGAIFQALSERAQTPSDVAAASEAAAALLDACAAGGVPRSAPFALAASLWRWLDERDARDATACNAWFALCLRLGHTKEAFAAARLAEASGFEQSALMRSTLRQTRAYKASRSGSS